MTTENAGLFAAIAAVMADVRSLPKDGYNQQNRYNYVSSDTALDHIGKAMAAHGVVVIPSMFSYDTITDDPPGKMTRAKVEFDMHVCSADGGAFVSRWIAEGIDYGNPDKALTKAITYATKTFLMKLFVVGAGGDDPDGESAPEIKQTQDAPKVKRIEAAPPKAPIDPDKATKHFHAAGVELFGDAWDAARPLVVERYTSNETHGPVRTSSTELRPEELSEIAGTFKKAATGWKKWLEETMAAKESEQVPA